MWSGDFEAGFFLAAAARGDAGGAEALPAFSGALGEALRAARAKAPRGPVRASQVQRSEPEIEAARRRVRAALGEVSA